MEAFMMIERNWSPIIILSSTPETTVEVTRLTVLRTARSNIVVRLSSILLTTIQAPKQKAHRMSHIVSIIPAIPRVATRLLIES